MTRCGTLESISTRPFNVCQIWPWLCLQLELLNDKGHICTFCFVSLWRKYLVYHLLNRVVPFFVFVYNIILTYQNRISLVYSTKQSQESNSNSGMSPLKSYNKPLPFRLVRSLWNNNNNNNWVAPLCALIEYALLIKKQLRNKNCISSFHGTILCYWFDTLYGTLQSNKLQRNKIAPPKKKRAGAHTHTHINKRTHYSLKRKKNKKLLKRGGSLPVSH